MPRYPSSQPTEVELQILRILWEHGPSTAREIHNQLAGERETNYSTTVKMLSVMLDKKLVKRDETVRPQVYRTVATQDRTQERMLKDLIRKAYDGSVGSLVMQALSSQKSSPEELAEIRRLLNELEGGREMNARANSFSRAGILEASWAERIGWTLLHSLWQIALIAGVYALVAALLRKRSAQARYLCGCAALLAMLVRRWQPGCCFPAVATRGRGSAAPSRWWRE